MRFLPKTLLSLCVAFSALLLPMAASAQAFDDSLHAIQREWARINYATPEGERSAAFESLAGKAAALVAGHSGRAEALIWHGIVLSSWAGARGGLGALGLVDDARGRFEQAIAIDAGALDGSALASLGVLYHKVPGWPLAFGSDRKAKVYLERALEANPAGIDPNFFYGEYLLDTGHAAEAVRFLEKALAAPPRAGREQADEGRRQEVRTLLARARSEAG